MRVIYLKLFAAIFISHCVSLLQSFGIMDINLIGLIGFLDNLSALWPVNEYSEAALYYSPPSVVCGIGVPYDWTIS